MKRLIKIGLVLAIFSILLVTIAIATTTKQNVVPLKTTSGTKIAYSAIFGTIDRDGKFLAKNSGGELSNVSFNLPVAANVYATSSGLMTKGTTGSYMANFYFTIDGWAGDWEYNHFHETEGYSRFEISQLYPKLKAGKHTISVIGSSDEDITIDNLLITVIVNQNGKINIKSTG